MPKPLTVKQGFQSYPGWKRVQVNFILILRDRYKDRFLFAGINITAAIIDELQSRLPAS